MNFLYYVIANRRQTQGFPGNFPKNSQPGFENEPYVSGNTGFGGMDMKKETKENPQPGEAYDPKPPVIQSGHMENRRQPERF